MKSWAFFTIKLALGMNRLDLGVIKLEGHKS
jgi:hypothetical protein